MGWRVVPGDVVVGEDPGLGDVDVTRALTPSPLTGLCILHHAFQGLAPLAIDRRPSGAQGN